MIYDVLIIGAGVTGVMTARLLSAKNCTTAVVEAECDVAMGATRANSAIVHAGYDCKPGTLKAKLNVRGNRLMKELCAQLDVPIRCCGSHVVAFSEDDMTTLRELYDKGAANGVPDMRIISKEELLKMEPNVSDKAFGSLWAPTAAITCPYGICIAAAENAATNGVDFFFNFRVNGASYNGETWQITNGTNTVEARYVINCAGVNSDKTAQLLGERDFPISITPRRGEYIVMDKICGKMANSTLFVCPSGRGKGILVSPTVDGNLLIGPNAYHIDDPDDKSTTADGLAEITEGAKLLMPSVDTRNAITSFSGVRSTPNIYDYYIKISDGLPHVIHAVGVESPGFASSPATAEYLAELLVDAGLTLTDRDDYIPTRRADGNHKHFNDMTPEEKTEAIRRNPAYGKIVCRCETVTEGDLIDAIISPIPAVTVDMLKRRTRAGMGRCQGGFCSPRAAVLIAEHTNSTLDKVTKSGGGSWIVTKRDSE
ncbi:MAG: NAD(P)/FAD-dependent oxidoreductase [Ruminococcaceae bacterium]|nr:NAD(P)/FAD-dependent oxidoreductase [Oscillospiraceae bacterium]